MLQTILDHRFFERPTLKVAQNLIGKFIVRKQSGKEISLMINEVEAYDGFFDKASHAHRGQTPRTSVMFGPPGVWYIYFCYGVHWMINIVTGPPDYPAAILIRGAGDTSGPGRLSKVLKIEKSLNGSIAAPESGLWIEDRGVIVQPSDTRRTPRIGVSYAGTVWSKKPYRFVLKK